MNLIVDIGNTRTKLAFFSENHLVEKAVFTTQALDALSAKVQGMGTIEAAIFSASGVDTEGVENYLKQHFQYVKFDYQTPIPIKNDYGTPQTLGKDRLAGVIGAQGKFENQNCLVIDAGTCLTYNVLTAAGSFLGGNITPGLTMRLKAMHHFTAKLPLVERDTEESQKWVGKSTEEGLRIGAQMGIVAEVEGFYRRLKKELGDMTVVLTGGDGAFLHRELRLKKIDFDPDLVVKGLNRILNHNLEL